LLFSLGVHEVIRSTNILAILCMVNGQCCNQLFNLEHILCCYVFLLLMYFLSPGAYTNLSIHFEYFFSYLYSDHNIMLGFRFLFVMW
jgi:hypothetical protein